MNEDAIIITPIKSCIASSEAVSAQNGKRRLSRPERPRIYVPTAAERTGVFTGGAESQVSRDENWLSASEFLQHL